MLAKKISSHFDKGIHMILFIQFLTNIFFIHVHHCRFQIHPAVMLEIIVGFRYKTGSDDTSLPVPEANQ
jgi:hypothetical protein